ncbi:hypothetical protein M3Y99_00321100 [Aphelenchoides fujianensis]|nr:hypothetical protein M3Y99_00321100 [Aphelenchoides fujianensis]
MKSTFVLFVVATFALCLHSITAAPFNGMIAEPEEFFEVQRRFNAMPKFRGEPIRFGKRAAYREPIRFGKRSSFGQSESAFEETFGRAMN